MTLADMVLFYGVQAMVASTYRRIARPVPQLSADGPVRLAPDTTTLSTAPLPGSSASVGYPAPQGAASVA